MTDHVNMLHGDLDHQVGSQCGGIRSYGWTGLVILASLSISGLHMFSFTTDFVVAFVNHVFTQ